MSVQLLDKTRKIGQLLHNNNSSKVVFNDICGIMTQILDSNVLVISRKGKVLGVSISDHVEELTQMIVDRIGNFIDPMLNERFLSILSTKENVNLETLGFTGEDLHRYQAIVNPIEIAGERLGTVFMYRTEKPYEIDDIILSEYGTTVLFESMADTAGYTVVGVSTDSAQSHSRRDYKAYQAVAPLDRSVLLDSFEQL